MPQRHLSIAAYAAGASLAAITLVYVFGPTFFLDDDVAASNNARSTRKNGVVGLINPANDCFINSVLQALAGLPELRAFLIREIHRRELEGWEKYSDVTPDDSEQISAVQEKEASKGTTVPEWKLVGLQQGLATVGLKDILNALNERTLFKKAVSAQPFIRILEQSLRTRISRSQQDAQEFLQLIVERLAEERRAGQNLRRKLKKRVAKGHFQATDVNDPPNGITQELQPGTKSGNAPLDAGIPAHDEAPFPLEGQLEAQVECSHCGFKPKPSVSSFLTLTLNIPFNSTNTTLNACLDGMLKVEHIEDFRCDNCRLEHALAVNARALAKTTIPDAERTKLQSDREQLELAIKTDPEKPPKDVTLPDISTAPKRKISRHMRISRFPQVLAVHLSRSIWDPQSVSSKNMAKVAFPESLSLGGLLERKTFRLLAVVMHKGGHNSGHYETFRRQVLHPPFSTPASLGTDGIYSMHHDSTSSPRPSTITTPQSHDLSLVDAPDSSAANSPAPSSQTTTSEFSRQSLDQALRSTSARPATKEATPRASMASSARSRRPPSSMTDSNNGPESSHERKRSSISVLRGPKRKPHDRWWRISDDKVKESKTSDVLAMQREVYMLFYEMAET